MTNEYIIIPGTQQRIYEGTVVMLQRLPNLKWIVHYGYYTYNGKTQKGWYFSSIPSDTTMPVFNEDLYGIIILDGSQPAPPVPPIPPPGPFPPGPYPPAPVPIPFTPKDKAQLDSAMLTVDDLAARDRLGRKHLQDGKIVRVNDSDGQGNPEYYSWDAATSKWVEASLGYRYMTRSEIMEAVADDIIDIVWSNENGALVVTNHAGTPVNPIKLMGVAHDPIYTEEDLTLRIPVYGHDDFVMTIPRDYYIRSIRFEPNWVFEDHHVGPAIVVVVSDGVTEKEIAGDASGIANIYYGEETATARIIIEQESGKVTADVKLSSLVNNPLKIDNEGLWVDLSGVVGKKQIQTGFLLVADGQGEFTYGGTGAELEMTTAIADLTNPEKKVVTAKLIADAISAAISALEISIERKIGDLEARIVDLENKVDIGEGENGVILITNGDGMTRSAFKIGGPTLDTESNDTLATEEAMTKALSWTFY